MKAQKKYNIQSEKAMIFIENLEQRITEDYLYRKFQDVGEIKSIKIYKDKKTQKSKGQACITFENPNLANQARNKFNNVVFIKNIIRVKPYVNYHQADKEANIFINNLPMNSDTLELEKEFSRYGSVLSVDIQRNKAGKALSYGYVQFENKEDADQMLASQEKEKIIYKGQVLKLEYFKSQFERKSESTSLYLRAFARPLNDNEFTSAQVLKAVEFAWQLLIKDFFVRTNVKVESCFVKIDYLTRQPWATINFQSADLAKNQIYVCEKNRFHPSIKQSAAKALELLKKNMAPVNSDGTLQFEFDAVAPFFETQAKSSYDVFKGESKNFFYNQTENKNLNSDDRLILVQNIRENVSKEELTQFFEQFGKVIQLTVKKPTKTRLTLQQCFVHYQTIEDSQRARVEVYDHQNAKVVEQRNNIFKDGCVKMNILMSGTLRKQFKQIQQRSKSIFQNSTGRILLKPQEKQTVHHNNRSQTIPYRITQDSSPTRQRNIQLREVQNKLQNFSKQQFFYPFPQQVQMPPQVNAIEKFSSYEIVVENMDDFNKLPIDLQRKILGNLLVFKIDSLTNEKQYIKTIVDMLVDEKQFDIAEILYFLESEAELNERVEEALELIHQNNDN